MATFLKLSDQLSQKIKEASIKNNDKTLIFLLGLNNIKIIPKHFLNRRYSFILYSSYRRKNTKSTHEQ